VILLVEIAQNDGGEILHLQVNNDEPFCLAQLSDLDYSPLLPMESWIANGADRCD
jgi:hypothetical protein